MHRDLLQRSSLITSKRNFNPLKLYSRKDVHEFLLYAIIVVIVSKKGQDIEKIWPEPRTSSGHSTLSMQKPASTLIV